MVNHHANADVLAWLQDHPGGVHPDLADFVRESGAALGARCEEPHGHASLVNDRGIVFAYAQGTHIVVFRIPDGGFHRELPFQGDAPRVPRGWVATDAWLGSRMDWNVRAGDAAVQERFFAAALGAV